ncbi:amidohydrolase family protein [Thermodesulfobacteriota bacterium]
MIFDMVIHNGTIITVNPDFDIIEKGTVCIKDGRIERLEASDGNIPLPEAEEIIDVKGGIIMPGLVNTHTHLPMTLFRGLADDLPLSVWLNEHIFPAEGRHIHPASVELGALLACSEMLLSGTTTCCDGYFLEDHVASALNRSGMRAVLGQGVIDFPAPGVPNPLENIKNAVTYIEKWQEVSPLITPSIFCHSPYTCSVETLQKAKAVAVSNGLLFQIHVAETRAERDQIQAAHGISPVQHLDRIGILDEKTLLVHGVWLDDDDIDIIKKRRAKVSHNPESNMKLSSGISPVANLIKNGVTVGLGTDGCASNNDLDLFQEMDMAAKLHKVDALDPTVMDARSVLKMATIKGAEAIGLDRDIGSLEAGKAADLIVIDTAQPHLVPMYNPVSHIVYAVRGSDVRDVIVSGRILVKDRKLMTLDLEEILEKVAEISQIIKKTKAP